MSENKTFIQSYFQLYMQNLKALEQQQATPQKDDIGSKVDKASLKDALTKEPPKTYNTLAKSMVSGAVKKLSYLGTSGMSMPSMPSIPKLGWYKTKKEDAKPSEESKEPQLAKPSQDMQEDVPNFTSKTDSDEETAETTKQEIAPTES